MEHGLLQSRINPPEIILSHGHYGPVFQKDHWLRCPSRRCRRRSPLQYVREIVSNIPTPKYLNLDNDPLYRFDRWAPELEAMMINPIYSIPLTPISHPFVERLIGSVRREYLDRLFFWNTLDLQHKLDQYRDYFNEHRVHAGIDGDLPNQRADEIEPRIASLENYSWDSHCNGLFKMPKAA